LHQTIGYLIEIRLHVQGNINLQTYDGDLLTGLNDYLITNCSL